MVETQRNTTRRQKVTSEVGGGKGHLGKTPQLIYKRSDRVWVEQFMAEETKHKLPGERTDAQQLELHNATMHGKILHAGTPRLYLRSASSRPSIEQRTSAASTRSIQRLQLDIGATSTMRGKTTAMKRTGSLRSLNITALHSGYELRCTSHMIFLPEEKPKTPATNDDICKGSAERRTPQSEYFGKDMVLLRLGRGENTICEYKWRIQGLPWLSFSQDRLKGLLTPDSSIW